MEGKMGDKMVVAQCLTCKLAKDDPEKLTTVNRWLAENKAYKWIIARADELWGIELNERSLMRHFKNGHMPEWHRMAREAFEQVQGEEYADIQVQNLGALSLVAGLYRTQLIDKVASGKDINIPHNVGLQAIKEIGLVMADKPTEKSREVMNQIVREVIKCAAQCIPSVKQALFWNLLQEKVAPMMAVQDLREARAKEMAEAADIAREKELLEAMEEEEMLEEASELEAE